jgi:hypothetical protein
VSTFQHVHLCDSDDSVDGSSIMDEAIEEGWMTDYDKSTMMVEFKLVIYLSFHLNIT